MHRRLHAGDLAEHEPASHQHRGFPYSGPEISSYGYANYKGPGTFDSEISLGPGSSGRPIWTTGANGVLTVISTVSTPSNAAAQTASSAAQITGWEGQDNPTIVGNTVTGAQGKAASTP